MGRLVAKADRKHDAALGLGVAGATVRLNTNRQVARINDRARATRVSRAEEDLARYQAMAKPTRAQAMTRFPGVPAGQAESMATRAHNKAKNEGIGNAKKARKEGLKHVAVSRKTTQLLHGASTGVAVTGLYYGLRGRGESVRKYTERQVDVGFVTGMAGIGAHQGAGYGISRTKGRQWDAKITADAEARAKYNAQRDAHGIHPGTPRGHPDWLKLYRDYPRGLPGSKTRRVLARTHGGKSGAALTLGIGAASGIGGARMISKGISYEVKGHDVRVGRAAETAVGLGTLAWGGSRLGMVKTTLGLGRRIPGNVGMRFERAEKLRAGTQTQTGRASAALGRGLGVGSRNNWITHGLRPYEAVGLGTVLTLNAQPVVQRKLVQRVQVVQSGQGKR